VTRKLTVETPRAVLAGTFVPNEPGP